MLGHPILPYGFKCPFCRGFHSGDLYYLADAQVLSDEWSPVVMYGGESVVHYAPGCHFWNGESCHYVRIRKGHCEGLPGVYMVYRKRLMLRSCVHFNANLVDIFDVGFMTFLCNFRALVYELAVFSRMKKLLFIVATCKTHFQFISERGPYFLLAVQKSGLQGTQQNICCLSKKKTGVFWMWILLVVPFSSPNLYFRLGSSAFALLLELFY